MATVKIDQFGGIAPRQHPTQLADGMAVTAHNCRLKTGKLVPLREPKVVDELVFRMQGGLEEIKDAKSMHVWRTPIGDLELLLFPGVTWMAPGNVADDEQTRVVVSGDMNGDGAADEPTLYIREKGLYFTYPIRKDPLPAPVASRESESPLDGEVRYTRFFVTWVDANGMESPVSPPSLVKDGDENVEDDLKYIDGDEVSLVVEDVENNGDMQLFRVYKVVTGTEAGRIQFVREFGIDAYDGEKQLISMRFAVKDEDAGEIMPEIEAPPADLSCIHDVPGAFYVGFAPSMPKTVCFSDIDLLYSWPIAYRYDVADNLVALAVTSNSVFALTEGWPYVISGTAPESMSVAKLAGPAACVSARGVCVYRNAVYFVSNQGLMTIYNSADAGTVCQNLTDKIFTKDQWLALNPSSCVMGQHDGALFLYFAAPEGSVYTLRFIDPNGVLNMEHARHIGLTIDLMENAAIAVTTHDEAAKCLCVDVKEDKLYFVREEA